MLTTRRLVTLLRVLLALAFAALLFAQLRALPAIYDDWTRDAPEQAQVELLAASMAGLLCVQVVVVCTWRLLTMVAEDRIFSADSMVWVNVIVAAMATGWMFLLGGFLYVLAPGGPSDVAATALLLLLVAVAVVGLLMAVMRALLQQATALRTEMEAVV